MTWHPAQCTEREDGPWTDCTWCTGVMLANAAEGRDVHPVTRREYEALRAASGDDSGGSGLDELQRGMNRRYGWSPALGPNSWYALDRAMVPGEGLAVQGHLKALNAHYNRWNSTRVAHASYLQVFPDRRLWWQNPLAPATYPGEYISRTAVKAFFLAKPGARFMAVTVGERGLPDTSTEDPMDPVAISEPLDATIGLTKGIGLYDVPDGTKLRNVVASDPATVPGLFRSGTWIAIAIPSATTTPTRLVYVKRAEVTVTRDPVPDCSAVQKQLDIAQGRIRAAITDLGGTP